MEGFDQNEFWKNEFPSYSFEEKKQYLLGMFYQNIRWQSEFTDDVFNVINKDFYSFLTKEDEQMDSLLKYVFKSLDELHEADGEVAKELWLRTKVPRGEKFNRDTEEEKN